MNLWIRKPLGCFPAWNPSVPWKSKGPTPHPIPPARCWNSGPFFAGGLRDRLVGFIIHSSFPAGGLDKALYSDIFWNYPPRRMRLLVTTRIIPSIFQDHESQPKLTFMCDDWILGGGVARVDGIQAERWRRATVTIQVRSRWFHEAGLQGWPNGLPTGDGIFFGGVGDVFRPTFWRVEVVFF